MTRTDGKLEAISGDVTNGARPTLEAERPYTVAVTIRGTAAVMFHRWQSDAVEAKAKAARGSAAKKRDDVESYVWRDADGNLALPGEYLRAAMVDGKNGAAKFRQDPRSSRPKQALDLFRAGVVALTELATLRNAAGEVAATWDEIDRRRVVVQRSGITRERPVLLAGWSASVMFGVLLPQYIAPALLHDVLADAGRFVGVADFRPTFGRFQIVGFDVAYEA